MHEATDNHRPNPDWMTGLLDRKAFAAQCGRCERTIIRWERAGMPFIKLGYMRLYDMAKVRAWIMEHEYRHAAPKRGRSASKRAA